MVDGADVRRWPHPGGEHFSAAVSAGPFVHLAAVTPSGADGRGAAGDIKAQTRLVLERLGTALETGGSSLARTASVHVYLRNMTDFAAMNEVYATFWPQDPPVRTTIVAAVSDPVALVEMSAIGIVHGAPREVIHPAEWVRSPNPYSYGIRSGDTLFLSGLVARSGRDNRVVEGDVSAQTRTVLDNGAEILRAAGMSFADVVAARVFITDVASYDAMNAAYRPYFPDQRPTRVTVVCPLMNPTYLVEITMVAVAGSRRHTLTPAPGDGTPAPLSANVTPGIGTGDRVFVSGMKGLTAGNAGDVAQQTREAVAAVARVLSAAGVAWREALDLTVFLPDLSTRGTVERVLRDHFGTAGPAVTIVGAGLVTPGARVELVTTATAPAAGR
jgi:aminoacrylate peracid reductase